MTKVYRALRQRVGTQAEVAEALEVDKQTVSNRERGVTPILKEAELAIRYVVAEKEGRIAPEKTDESGREVGQTKKGSRRGGRKPLQRKEG